MSMVTLPIRPTRLGSDYARSVGQTGKAVPLGNTVEDDVVALEPGRSVRRDIVATLE